MQTWTTGFDSSKPSRLKVPTWVTLRGIPGEFLSVAKEIAGGLGELLGNDRRNSSAADQRFCVALQAGEGWTTQLSVSNEVTGEQVLILVDYCNLPIRCRCCYFIDHLIKDCPGVRVTRTRSDTTDGAPAEDRVSSATSQQPPGAATEAGPIFPAPIIPVMATPAPAPVQVDPLMGTNSEETTSRSGNHYSNGDSRETPEWEWNGWEKVPRHKKAVRGPKTTTANGDRDSRPSKTVTSKEVQPRGTNQQGAARNSQEPGHQGTSQQAEPRVRGD